jgi:hypothetical protein
MKHTIAPPVRSALVAAALVISGAMGGCAALRAVSTEVSTFGAWPADRKPGSYAFDRLPSQQADPAGQQQIEDAAATALQAAGFTAAAAGATPDVLVQLGLTVSRSDRSPWDDPIWWRGGFGRWHAGPWYGPHWGWGMSYGTPRWDREVALLLRDRATGAPLYEAHASADGSFSADASLIAALYQAALSDFPQGGANPRRVTVQRPE